MFHFLCVFFFLYFLSLIVIYIMACIHCSHTFITFLFKQLIGVTKARDVYEKRLRKKTNSLTLNLQTGYK